MAYHNWFALPERPVSDARAPFVLPEYLKMALSKNIMSNVARQRAEHLVAVRHENVRAGGGCDCGYVNVGIH